MILKLFRRTTDPRLAPYPAGDTDGAGSARPHDPLLLDGAPGEFSDFIRGSSSKNRYLSLAFSWSENWDAVSQEAVMAAVRDGLDLLFRDTPAMDRVQLLYLHRRAKGFDIHAGVGRVSLRRGREMPCYSDLSPLDRATLETWQRHTNLKNGWSDPGDPARKRFFKVLPVS
jgi:hypothetical protein